MTLTLHHADRLEPLLERLADLLQTPLDDPFMSDVVVVPTAGVRDAITAHLGSRLGVSARGHDGIAANVELVYIGRFVNRALGIDSGSDSGDVDPDPWHISRLTWTVLDVLASGAVAVPTADVTWSFARRVADLFDRYATQRPDMIQHWADDHRIDGVFSSDGTAAPLPADHLWQFELWKAVRARVATPSLPERLPELLSQLASGEPPSQLPPRVALVGFGSLAPAQWRLLRALGQSVDVHVLLRTPSTTAWTSGPIDLAGALVGARGIDAPDVAASHRHPLLVSWGRRALEARAFVGGIPGVSVVDASSPADDRSTLLQTLQSDIRHDRTPAVWPGYAESDLSLQVHACHGEVRQVEVLRDALGHLFVDNPDLRPRDVVVLCPQLDRFAPLVEAVFGRGDMKIPVRVGDRSLTSDDPVASAFQAVLALAQSRVSLSEVLTVIQLAPVRRRFGWSVADVETITAWAVELGTRWGLSPHHRMRWGLPSDVTSGTWQVFLQQLLAGLVQSAPSPRLGFGDIPPVDGLDAEDAHVVGSFAEFVARLDHLRATLVGVESDDVGATDDLGLHRPITVWVDHLHHALDDFCGRDPLEPWAIDTVHAALDDLLEAATPTPSGVASTWPLDMADVRAMLDEAIRERAGRLSLRTGAVTVTSLQPMHGVPARVVCFLGLDDGSLPSSSFDGDDILGINPCIGERNPRHDGRQMLLDSFLAATDAVIVTCNGADITTNAKKPFIVPLAELLDVVATTVGTESLDHLAMVARHPRHGFADVALLADATDPLLPGLGRPFSFDSAMRKAAKSRQRRIVPPNPAELVGRWTLAPTSAPVLGLAEVVSGVQSPGAQMLDERLDVATLPRRDPLIDGLELAIDSLGMSSLGRQLLDMLRERHPEGLGSDASKYKPNEDPAWVALADEWMKIAVFDGSLPPAVLGASVLDDVVHLVMNLWWAVHQRQLPLAPSDAVHVSWSGKAEFIDGSVTPLDISGEVTGIHRRDDESVIVDIRFARPKPRYLLAAAIKLAMCQLSHPGKRWSAEVITRNSGKGASVHRLTLHSDRSAESLVTLAAQLTWWGRSDAVPLFDETSFAVHHGADIADLLNDLDSELGRDAAEVLWRGWTAENLAKVPVLDDDPPWLSRTAPSRLQATADWVWGTYARAVFDQEPVIKSRNQVKVKR